MLALRLPQELEDRLTALAEKTGQSKSYHARKAIMEYIGDLEDYAIAEQTSRAIREGREKTIPLADILQKYRLTGSENPGHS